MHIPCPYLRSGDIFSLKVRFRKLYLKKFAQIILIYMEVLRITLNHIYVFWVIKLDFNHITYLNTNLFHRFFFFNLLPFEMTVNVSFVGDACVTEDSSENNWAACPINLRIQNHFNCTQNISLEVINYRLPFDFRLDILVVNGKWLFNKNMY